MDSLGLLLGILGLLIWLGLILGRGQFWRTDIQLPLPHAPGDWPPVAVLVPARNEAEAIPRSLKSLLDQDYPGPWQVFLVDDQSDDGTGDIALHLARDCGCAAKLTVIKGQPLPAGWTGKLWALEQGVRQAEVLRPEFFLFTDADIAHSPDNLRTLVAQAQTQDLALVSLMVLLRCENAWDRLLIPPFVFFFAQLYPFRWVNDRGNSTAAAAGGCILVRREALARSGGLTRLRQALIDDCSLAAQIKSTATQGVWLGLTRTNLSLRPYGSLASVWDMVARSAFTQLNYSWWLLGGTVVAMIVVYLGPLVSLVWGLVGGDWLAAGLGLAGYGLMTLAYLPMVRFYGCSPLWAGSLPVAGLLYTLMTVDSAVRHTQGRGGAWKGRVYPGGLDSDTSL